MSTPSTNIHLCSGVPLNNKYDHTLWFATPELQFNYFNSMVNRTFNAYSYVRKTWKLKVAATMEAARVWSYLFFQNGNGKRYFYFVNQIEYINDNTVELTLEIDVIQTYMFDWKLNPCYVEREHSVLDLPGENTVDEGLELGELITARLEKVDLTSQMVVLVASSIDLNKYYIGGIEDRIVASKYDNLFGGFQVTAVPVNAHAAWDNMAWDELAKIMFKLEQDGKLDAIFTMWQYPGQLVNWNNGNYETAILKYVTGQRGTYHVTGLRPSTIDGYTPKNRKLLQYPYAFIYATNNQGGAAIYHYDLFDQSYGYQFNVKGNIAPDGIVKLVPYKYKGVDGDNFEESLTMGNFPICSWNSDTYKLWLAQNQSSQNMGLVMEGLKIAGGAAAIVGGVLATGATGGAAGFAGAAGITSGAGMIMSGASGIASQLAQRADRDVQPPQARGTITGSFGITHGLTDFHIHHKTIDAYHAEMIDNYFTMYGYATRKVKIPNILSRRAFNYVKTVGSNVTGDICMEDLRTINAIFDKGITFWKNHDLGNYSLDNKP